MLHQLNYRFGIRLVVLLVALILIVPLRLNGQVRSGAGYLKMLPGPRQAGVANTQTGALDYAESFYANPGATGLMRSWQWSATYTNWVSDLYNASLLAGGRMKTRLSHRTHVALGVNYLGIPEFDSSNRNSPLVSGRDVLVTGSVGQPFSVFSSDLSFGANLKFLNSELAQFNASAWVFDFGVLYRTPRFQLKPGDNSFLKHAILSAGVAVNNLGQSLTFVSESTPLPRVLRAGIALNLGMHHGFQTNLATDYHRVRDEEGFFSFGGELSWSSIVALRAGYSFEENILGGFSLGASFRFDEGLAALQNFLPGRNNALRFDLAARQSGAFSSSPYNGGLTHYPIGPEPFELVEPLLGAMANEDSMRLAWEVATDPDLFDEVRYWLLVDQDSLNLARIIADVVENSARLQSKLQNGGALVAQETNENQHLFQDLESGDYYWTVIAHDLDNHVRVAESRQRQMGHFHVTRPDLQITGIEFQHHPWITQDDLQGTLIVKYANQGDRDVDEVALLIHDEHDGGDLSSVDHQLNGGSSIALIHEARIQKLPAGTRDSLRIAWHTQVPGLHQIAAEIQQVEAKPGESGSRDSRASEFYTIPKGVFATNDTTIARVELATTYELPIIGRVFFDSSSAAVKPTFVREWVLEPPLRALGRRLHENPSLEISLQGKADPNSGERDVRLAEARAESVKDSLLLLGASAAQIHILPGVLLPERRLPADTKDRQWILQERRVVEISTTSEFEAILFRPIELVRIEAADTSIAFESRISGVIPVGLASLQLETDAAAASVVLPEMMPWSGLAQQVNWRPVSGPNNGHEAWLEKTVSYTVVLVDSLGRQFATRPQQTYLKTETIMRERVYFGVARFAQAEPFYDFYWQNLLEGMSDFLEHPDTRLRFVGHACAIGPEPVNLTLSRQRAELFYERLLRDLKQKYPANYDDIVQRVDRPEGLGESQPFRIRTEVERLVGDNEHPLGRLLNRRVMALIYSTGNDAATLRTSSW